MDDPIDPLTRLAIRYGSDKWGAAFLHARRDIRDILKGALKSQ
jgi:hypothetical protein